MRRLWVLVIACALALGGCTQDAGTAVDIGTGWSPVPAPTRLVPHVGDCFDGANIGMLGDSGNMLSDPPLPCDEQHRWEAVAIGRITGSIGKAPNPPILDAPTLARLVPACAAPTRAYLGGDWRRARIDLEVMLPDAMAWSGGARWYACVAGETRSTGFLNGVERTSSLRHLLAGRSSLNFSCVDWIFHRHSESNIEPTTCSKPHSGEFAGYFTLSGTAYPSAARIDKISDVGCKYVVARYVGVSSPSDLSYTIGWVWTDLPEEQWDNGTHFVRCFAAAYAGSHRFHSTVKGIGPRAARV